MRKRLAGVLGAVSLSLTMILTGSTGANAFIGLSDGQKAHIDEYFMCQWLLLTDIPTYEATEPCGGTPTGGSLLSGKGSSVQRKRECEYQYAFESLISDYCDNPR
jgi:hypothetical protein